MDYIYFGFIHRDLCLIGARWTDEEVLDKLQVLKKELRFLERFSRCFATEADGLRWDDTLEDGGSLASCLSDIRRDDWPRLASALVGKIELSKLDIERWCKLSLHGSLIWEPSRTEEILIFLDTVLNNLKDLSRYRRNNVSREKQRGTLEEKLVFLKNLLEVDADCIYSEELREFMTSVHNFAKESAKLTFMYWVNAREERIDLMISDMLQKIEPCTHGMIRTSLYGSQRYEGLTIDAPLNNLRDLSSYKGEKIVRFNKQIEILKRTVVFLKEVRMFAANGMDRNESLEFKTWVHVIGQKTADLTLECWLLDERFHEPLMVLMPCSARLEDNGSRNHDMLIFFLDSVLNNVKDLASYISKISCRADEIVPFMRENFWRLAANGINRSEFRKFKTWIHAFALSVACLTLDCWYIAADEDFVKMNLVLSEMQQKLQPRRRHIKAYLLQSLKYKAVKRYQIPIFLDALQDNLKHLVGYNYDEIDYLERYSTIQEKKRQTKILKKKVVFLKSFCRLAANGVDGMEFGKFMTCVQVFAENVACLTLQCWLISADEEFSTKMDLLLPEMLQELQPCMPHVMASFFGTLWQSDLLLLGETVSSFVDLLLDNFSTHLKDDFQMLRDGLIFLLTFVAVPQSKCAKNLFLVHKDINILLHEGSRLISPEKQKTKNEVPLYSFVRKIEQVNSKIKQLYFKPNLSSYYKFPRIIGQGFLDFLIQNLRALKEKQTTDNSCVPFAKYKIMRIEEELVSFRPFFNNILEVQDEQKELKLQVIDLVHLAEYVTNLCFESDDPVWYHMAYLSDVLDRIEAVKSKIEPMKECNIYKVRSVGIISEHTRATEINEVVGFKDEANIIIEKLVRGHKSFDIVSIVGMAGIGKTTLARKVYGHPSVKGYFHVCAFSSVSRDHRPGRLLLEILRQITVIDDDDHLSLMTEHDLGHRLSQCLSQQKYLIVLDDIWDIRAWNDVKSSFPDDQNGSRVMFTTRSREVALEATTATGKKINSSPYALSFLSEEKSWELLQRKVFYNDSPPPDLSDVGKQIAKNCKGLPLAVVVISGLLEKKERNLSQWTEISGRIGFHLSEEGFMDIFELIYEHLPEHLKPCLLYFGGFPQSMMIPTKILMLLWIAEGFVKESERKASVKMANKYLNDLADRSLIIVNGRSSSGGIKSFRVHDLIHDFCQKKAREENFCFLGPLCEEKRRELCSHHHRVSLQFANFIVGALPRFPSMHSLLCFSRDFGRFDIQRNPVRLKLLQVLYLKFKWLEGHDLESLTQLVHLRHIEAPVNHVDSVPSSISSLWKLETLILRTLWKGEVLLPETIWTMTRLRHVNISRCKLTFCGGHGHEGYPQLGNVESFSSPTLSTGEDLQQLLQRLPAVRKLSCRFDKSNDSGDGQVEKLDFDREIESLNLTYVAERSPYVMIFPSTLKKLKLVGFKLPWTAISDISNLPCLEVLKLLRDSFVGNSWDMDVGFPSLKFLKMDGLNLVNWSASDESFCCLEQLFVTGCARLIDIPSCLGEMPTLRRLEVHACTRAAASSANEIKKAQRDSGNELLP